MNGETKYTCEVCERWTGTEPLTAPNPFIEGDELQACPVCRSMSISVACEIDGCKRKAEAGTAINGGYITTCSKHIPRHEQ